MVASELQSSIAGRPDLQSSVAAEVAGSPDGSTAAAAADEPGPLQNRAASSRSPYVSEHADSLVAWQLLDDEAVDLAKKTNKPIFLHIGYKSCHCKLRARPSPSPPSPARARPC